MEEVWAEFARCESAAAELRGSSLASGAPSDDLLARDGLVTSAPRMHCDDCCHERQRETSEALTCIDCGLVLEDTRLGGGGWEEAWVAPALSSKEKSWRAAMKRVLFRLGHPLDLYQAIQRPSGLDLAGRKLDAAAAYCVYLHCNGLLSEEHARGAGEASSSEWRGIAALLGPLRNHGLEEEDSFLLREGNRRGLPLRLVQAAATAMRRPELECCEPRAVLIAATAASLGPDVAAVLFGIPEQEASKLGRKHNIEAPCLDRQARALEERCRSCDLLERDEALLVHMKRCSSCRLWAQQLDLTFLTLL